MDNALAKPVAWIRGPSGSGKSSLVASYLASRNLPHIWYQVDEGDSDCATLFYYLGLAAKKVAPDDSTPLPLLTKEYQQGLVVFTRRYFENLFGRLPPSSVIVIDDYHEVGAGSQFHDVIQHALEEIPQGINVILISRDDPPSTLARLRSRRRIGFISWEELRLNADEIGGIVQVHGDTPLSANGAGLLLEKTGGWIAGVLLMLERGDSIEVPGKINKQEVASVFDYFACEVFDKTDIPIQDFLLKTAFMQQFTSQMAYRLTGNSAAESILTELHSRNYFTETYAGTELDYQYHPLFREFLIHRALDLFPESLISQIKQASAEILEEYGRTDLAAELYLTARDWDSISRLVNRTAPALTSQGRSATLESWISRIPRVVLDETPWLQHWLGVCRFTDHILEARSLFESSLKLFRTGGDVAGMYLSWTGIANSFRYKLENLQALDQWIAVLDEIMRDYPAFPTPKIELRLSISMYTSLVLRQTDHQRIAEWEERVLSLLEKNTNIFLHVQAVYAMMLHELWRGNYARMRILLDSVRMPMAQKNTPHLATIQMKSMEAFYYWVTAQGDLCRRAVDEGMAMAQTSGIDLLNSRMMICKAQAAMIEEDASQLEKCYRDLGSCQPQDNNVNVSNYYFCWTMIALLGNDITRATSCIEAAESPVRKSGSYFHECLWHLGKAQVLLARKNNAESLLHVTKALNLSRHIKSCNLEYMSLLTAAWILFCRKDEEDGLQMLRQAMALGREHDYEYCMWWDPRMVAPLCVKALESGIEVAYVRQLVRRRRLKPEEIPLSCANWPWPIRVYTLGDFSIAVDDLPLQFTGKVQKKPIEMLKVLIALGGAERSEGQISDLLWPEVDGDTARNSFKVTLHRLRQLIGHEEAVQVRSGRLAMDKRFFWTDAWAFEQLLNAAQMLGESGAEEEAVRLTEKAQDLFRQHFLEGKGDKPWALSLRARLKNKFVLNTIALGNLYQSRGNREKALVGYLRGLELVPHSEDIYQNLIKFYLANGLRAEAITAYRNCKLALAEIGIAPSAMTESIYKTALKD
jgi:ATP/maltotriose-dependent transcriptional regulator MalT/DNA-binding SARP family transcriptional activator